MGIKVGSQTIDGEGGGSVTIADITDAGATGAALLATETAAAALAVIGLSPRLAPGSLLHLWRLGASPYSDLGSSPVALTATGASWLTGRSGVNVAWPASQQTTPANGGDRLGATLADIPAGSDFTIGCTLGKDPLQAAPADGAILFGLSDGVAYSGGVAGSFFTVQYAGGALLASTAIGGNNTNSSGVAIDTTKPHRVELTYVDATRTSTLYIDGVLGATAVIGSGTLPALTRAFFGGIDTYASISTSGGTYAGADLTVELTALSLAAIKARFDTVRAYLRGA